MASDEGPIPIRTVSTGVPVSEKAIREILTGVAALPGGKAIEEKLVEVIEEAEEDSDSAHHLHREKRGTEHDHHDHHDCDHDDCDHHDHHHGHGKKHDHGHDKKHLGKHDHDKKKHPGDHDKKHPADHHAGKKKAAHHPTRDHGKNQHSTAGASPGVSPVATTAPAGTGAPTTEKKSDDPQQAPGSDPQADAPKSDSTSPTTGSGKHAATSHPGSGSPTGGESSEDQPAKNTGDPGSGGDSKNDDQPETNTNSPTSEGGSGGSNTGGSGGNAPNDEFKVDFSKLQEIVGNLNKFQQEIDTMMLDPQVASYIGQLSADGSAGAAAPKTLLGGRTDAFVPAQELQTSFKALTGAVNAKLSWLNGFIQKAQTDVTIAGWDAHTGEETNSYNATDLYNLFTDLDSGSTAGGGVTSPNTTSPSSDTTNPNTTKSG